jgi:hypothetical protein
MPHHTKVLSPLASPPTAGLKVMEGKHLPPAFQHRPLHVGQSAQTHLARPAGFGESTHGGVKPLLTVLLNWLPGKALRAGTPAGTWRAFAIEDRQTVRYT